MATTGSGVSGAIAGTSGSYTLAQVVSRVRSRLDDTLEPYLWSNDEITEYLDTLQKSLVGEMPILDDKDDSTTCEVSLVQGDGLITLSPRIIRVVSAKISGETAFLELHDTAYMNANYSDWDSASVTQDTPFIMVDKGLGEDKAYLYPPLDAATGTLELQVYRMPLLDLDYDQDYAEYLEIDKYIHLVIHGIMWQAYLKQDTDTYDPKRAEQHRIYWEGANGHGGDKEKIRRLVLFRHQQPQMAGTALAFQ